MDVNFFWRGSQFSYLHRLCVLSHIGVGHQCVMWLSGETPTSEYWIHDLPVRIEDADEIINVTEFLQSGGNLKTASDLWSFSFLYQRGGLYCDTDAVAIKPFPEDDWIRVGCVPNSKIDRLSIGVMAAPKGHEVFLNCVNKTKKKWGNVETFADECDNYFGHSDSTHDDLLFYPYTWRQWNRALTDIPIPDVYSVHLYHTMYERNNKVSDKNGYDKKTLLGRIIERFDK